MVTEGPPPQQAPQQAPQQVPQPQQLGRGGPVAGRGRGGPSNRPVGPVVVHSNFVKIIYK